MQDRSTEGHATTGDRLKKTREILGLTKQEFSQLAGMSAQAYGAFENGERSLTLQGAKLLRKAYGLSLDFLFYGSERDLSDTEKTMLPPRPLSTPFSERITWILNQKGMNVSQLAKQAGLPYHQVHSWFRRENAKPSAEALLRVSEVLGISTSELLKGDEFVQTDLNELIRVAKKLEQRDLNVLVATAIAMSKA